MGTTATAKSKDFQIAPAGTSIARCYQVIDLGHQKVEWQGSTKIQPKVHLQFEILGEDRMEDGRPFIVHNRYTLSLSAKSHLRPMLEAWRGQPFTMEELEGFDIKSVLGAYCLLNVIHNTKGDKTYANISSIMAIPKGMPKPDPVNEKLYFNIDEDDPKVLPEWLQKVVAASMEKMKSAPGESDGSDTPPKDLDDDIPF